jgi:hypothetical protein
LPLDWLEPLLEVDEVDEDEDEELDVEDSVEPDPEEPVLLAVGVAEAEVRVLDEPEPELVDVDLVVVLELLLELVCVALGTVAATASEPTRPLAATIVVMVAVRALPCRTDLAAPSASMAVLHRGALSIRYPRCQPPMRRS